MQSSKGVLAEPDKKKASVMKPKKSFGNIWKQLI